MGGRPRAGPEGLAGGLRWRWAERTDNLESAERLGRDGYLAPTLGAALRGPYPDRASLEIGVDRSDGQGFGDPGAGVSEREGEGLVGGSWCPDGGFEEAPALIGGEVPVSTVLRRRARLTVGSRTTDAT